MKGGLDDEAATVHEEFEHEAVRLVATSGRTQRAVAGDLGIGLSALVWRIGRRRDRLSKMPGDAPQADIVAGLIHHLND